MSVDPKALPAPLPQNPEKPTPLEGGGRATPATKDVNKKAAPAVNAKGGKGKRKSVGKGSTDQGDDEDTVMCDDGVRRKRLNAEEWALLRKPCALF